MRTRRRRRRRSFGTTCPTPPTLRAVPIARVLAAALGITRTNWQYLRRQLRPVDVCAQQPVGARLIEHDAIELTLRVLLKRTNPLTADALPTHRLPFPVSCPDEVFNVGHVASIKGRG